MPFKSYLRQGNVTPAGMTVKAEQMIEKLALTVLCAEPGDPMTGWRVHSAWLRLDQQLQEAVA